jgi:formylmethanofuran dehydrogenase subunit E
MEIHWMRRPAVVKAKEEKVLRCTQCGEHLDVQRIRQLAGRADGMMCRDCAFDAPCTD